MSPASASFTWCWPSAAGLIVLCAAASASAQRSQPSPRGFTLAARVEHAAYAHPGVPSAVVHAPAHFDPAQPLQLVVFLHGFSGCAPVLAGDGRVVCRPGDAPREGWGLARQHDRAATNTLFIVPQLALLQRDGRPGCFGREGCFRRFLQELLRGPLAERLGAPHDLSRVAGISLVAHSAGFQTALAILQRGGVDALVRHVVLLDALYGGADGFARWLRSTPRPDAKLVSVHLGRGKPARNSERLETRLRRVLGRGEVARATASELAARVADNRLVVARGRGPHGRVPQHHLAELVRALWGATKASQ